MSKSLLLQLLRNEHLNNASGPRHVARQSAHSIGSYTDKNRGYPTQVTSSSQQIQGVTKGQISHDIKSRQIEHPDHIDFRVGVLLDRSVEIVN